MKTLATSIGLCIALGGPLVLFSPIAYWFGPPQAMTTLITGQLYLWFIALVLLAIVLFWEQKPISSVGLRPPKWRSLIFGIGTALLLLYIISPIGVKLITLLNLSGFEAGLAKLKGLPLIYLTLAGITAGTVEEFFYRGYAIERLSSWVNSRSIGSLLAVIAFGLVHIPFWGLGPAIFTLLPGIVLTLLYLWQRDLVANIIAHIIVGVVQLAPYAIHKT